MAGLIDLYLRPGDFCFTGRQARLHTVLGSCVSITLWHPVRRIGGMCHYMLPSRIETGHPGLDGRYADEAMRLFLAEIRRHHSSPEEYEAKMFGGGEQFRQHDNGRRSIAAQNVAAGLRLLSRDGFALGARDVGGTGSRRLIFELSTGAVWLRALDRARAEVST